MPVALRAHRRRRLSLLVAPLPLWPTSESLAAASPLRRAAPRGCEGPRRRVPQHRFRKCPAGRRSFFPAAALAASRRRSPRALTRWAVGIDRDVHMPITDRPRLPVARNGHTLLRHQHEIAIPRQLDSREVTLCVSLRLHKRAFELRRGVAGTVHHSGPIIQLLPEATGPAGQ